MYIISNVEGLLRYAGNLSILEIKPGVVTYVNENEFSYEELKACYGDRISLVEEEVARNILEVVEEDPFSSDDQDMSMPEENDKDEDTDSLSKEDTDILDEESKEDVASKTEIIGDVEVPVLNDAAPETVIEDIKDEEEVIDILLSSLSLEEAPVEEKKEEAPVEEKKEEKTPAKKSTRATKTTAKRTTRAKSSKSTKAKSK